MTRPTRGSVDHSAARPFVGREREIADLSAALERASEGEAAVYLVSGEPGAGKTYLADHIADIATDRGFAVLWGRAWEGDGAPPFWPWMQILRSLLRDVSPPSVRAAIGDGAHHLLRLIPEVAEHFPELSRSPVPLESEPARFELFRAVTELLHNVSRARPLFLVFDDLHFADRASALLLRFLAGSAERSRIIIAALYRGLEIRQSPSAEVFAELAPAARHLPLGPLATAEIAELTAADCGMKPSSSFAARLGEATGGNPFYVCEALRLLLAEGHSPEGPAPTRLPIPEGIRAVIRRRLAVLTPRARNGLAVAAVIGREFELGLLTRSSQLSPAEVASTLAEAQAADLLEAGTSSPSHQRFRHVLVRDVVYEEIPSEERPVLHRRVGDSLEEVGGAPGPHLAELAHHFLEAASSGDVTRAVDYAERAGRWAIDHFAYEDAALHFERGLKALELFGDGDAATRCRLQVSLGETLMHAGEYDRGREVLLAAAELAESMRFAEHLARAAVAFGGFHPGFDAGVRDADRIRLLDRARSTLPDGEMRLRALVAVQLARALSFSERRPEVAPLIDEAVATARALQDPALLAFVLLTGATASWGPDDLEGRIAVLEEAIALASSVHNRRTAASIRQFLSAAYLEAGRLAAAKACADAFRDPRLVSREPYLQMMVLVDEAGRALHEGRFGDVEPLAERIADSGRDGKNTDASGLASAILLILRREQGRSAELIQPLEFAILQFPGTYVFRCSLAKAKFDAGFVAEARQDVEAIAADGFAVIPRDLFWLAAMNFLADIVASLGDLVRAAEIYDLLLPCADRWAPATQMVSFGAVRRPLGRLATVLGRYDEAQAHFETALAMQATSPPLVAHTEIAYADMLTRRGRPEDRRRAAGLTEKALATARRLGMFSILGTASAGEAVEGAIHREDGSWKIRFGARSFSLVSAKGLEHLAELLANPGREVHVLELVGGENGAGQSEQRRNEVARVKVRRRITDALAKIRKHDPDLARYLARTIHTGAFCAYRPDPASPVVWSF